MPNQPTRYRKRPVEVEDLFFAERIWPCHTGGYWWRIEAVTISLFMGEDGFNESALGTASTKWGARRKIRRYKRQFTREATYEPAPLEGDRG